MDPKSIQFPLSSAQVLNRFVVFGSRIVRSADPIGDASAARIGE